MTNRRSRFPAWFPAWCPAPLIFAVNLFVCGRLLHIRYVDRMGSIEGVFIALEQYIQTHWPTFDWFAMWYGGMPFTRVYQPALHYAVAMLASAGGFHTATVYHAVTAITYSLGGVTFYWLARALTSDTATSLTGGLLFSLFSPSALLVPAIRIDVGGLWHARRLQALAVYGEGPNVTGLMLAMLALAVVHRALTRKTPITTCLAALAVAAVPATSWPATLALVMALLCYVLALSSRDVVSALGRLLVIGIGAFGFAAPFAPPSTILGTLAQADVMDEGPTPGPGRWIALGLMLLALIALRAALARSKAPFAVRFPLLWLLFTGWLVLAASMAGIRIIPYPARFHLAMEIPLLLATAIGAAWIVRKRSSLQRPAIAILVLFCCVQAYQYRRYAHSIIHPLAVEKTPEYQMARWADANLRGQRIFTRGTFGLWLNAFTDTPQMAGYFEQSIGNPENRIASYIVTAGYLSDSESADYSLLWLKTWAAGAIHMGGPNSADIYKDDRFPNRFRNVLPAVWSLGDDYVYRVPERTEGLARVVRARDLIVHPPVNGIDVAELRPFVAALDDASLPRAKFEWQGVNAAKVSGILAPDQVYSVAVNYDRGWTATRAGQPVAIHPDGMGMIALEPHCSGDCEIQMRWTQGREPAFAVAAFILTLAASVIWCAKFRRE